jgi:hypothetical protein
MAFRQSVLMATVRCRVQRSEELPRGSDSSLRSGFAAICGHLRPFALKPDHPGPPNSPPHDAGGIEAISRWLRSTATTPPDPSEKIPASRQGCQPLPPKVSTVCIQISFAAIRVEPDALPTIGANQERPTEDTEDTEKEVTEDRCRKASKLTESHGNRSDPIIGGTPPVRICGHLRVIRAHSRSIPSPLHPCESVSSVVQST